MTRAPWVSHFGFTRTPFRKTIPASQLCDRASHQEAVARIRFCIGESLLGVITGEVGVGKTVALRAATSQLDPSAHHIIYVATPTFGARGLYLTIVHALGAKPRAQKADLNLLQRLSTDTFRAPSDLNKLCSVEHDSPVQLKTVEPAPRPRPSLLEWLLDGIA